MSNVPSLADGLRAIARTLALPTDTRGALADLEDQFDRAVMLCVESGSDWRDPHAAQAHDRSRWHR